MTVKRAKTVRVEFCPNCKDPHVILYGDDGKPFAEGVIYSEHGPIIISHIEAILALRDKAKKEGKGDDDKKC